MTDVTEVEASVIAVPLVEESQKAPEDTPSIDSRPKRERKQVERLTTVVKEVVDVPFIVAEGTGTPLGEIDNVNSRLDKTKANTPYLKKLHAILFAKQKCSVKNVKSQLRSNHLCFVGHFLGVTSCFFFSLSSSGRLTLDSSKASAPSFFSQQFTFQAVNYRSGIPADAQQAFKSEATVSFLDSASLV